MRRDKNCLRKSLQIRGQAVQQAVTQVFKVVYITSSENWKLIFSAIESAWEGHVYENDQDQLPQATRAVGAFVIITTVSSEPTTKFIG